MTATYKKACPSCQGRGYNVLYVSEWAEMRERILLWFRRWV